MSAEAPKRRGRPPSGQREAILAATLELLPERGIAKLTTREIAAHAGVSEASVYYHFNDRPGLLKAVFELGLEPLALLGELPHAGGRAQVLTAVARTLDSFFERTLPVLIAAQSEPELHQALAAHMTAHDLGPHRGVRTIGAYLRAEQDAGRLDASVDTDAVALMLIGGCFTRAMQRHLLGQASALPSVDRVAAALDRLLAATEPPAPR